MSEANAAANAQVNPDTQSEPGAQPTTKTITMTDKALKELKRIMATDPTAQNASIRVMVVGGGCSGMSYKLGFENQPPAPSDKIFERDGVKVLVDTKSLLYLSGTELDFSDGLNGTGFSFNNPNAKRTCGCGSSFSA